MDYSLKSTPNGFEYRTFKKKLAEWSKNCLTKSR